MQNLSYLRPKKGQTLPMPTSLSMPMLVPLLLPNQTSYSTSLHRTGCNQLTAGECTPEQEPGLHTSDWHVIACFRLELLFRLRRFTSRKRSPLHRLASHSAVALHIMHKTLSWHKVSAMFP